MTTTDPKHTAWGGKGEANPAHRTGTLTRDGSKIVPLRLPLKLAERLSRHAAAQGLSRNAAAMSALYAALPDDEDDTAGE